MVVHLAKGRCDISLDLAGDLLSNRGYRVRTVEAPLREALAAAVVLYSSWDGQVPLHDPLCGSGTLAIEAALFGGKRAPNLDCRLACEKAPADAQTLALLRAELRARIGKPPTVLASDWDAEAVAAIQANARAAKVQLEVFEADARSFRGTSSPPGQLLLNVPYGQRLEAGGKKPLKTFYHQLGEALRRLEGHRAAILSASPEFESAFGIRPRGKRTLWNGPLRCGLYFYEL